MGKEKYSEELKSNIDSEYEKFAGLGPEKDGSRRQAVRNKLLSKVFTYISDIYGRNEAQSNGLEITETVISCLKAYQPEFDTPFSAYLDVSLRNRLRKEKSKRMIEDNRGGIHIPEKKDRHIRKIISSAQRMGKNLNDAAVRLWLADSLSMTIQEIDEYLEINQTSTVRKETDLSNEGDTCLFDAISSDYENPETSYHRTESSENYIISNFSILQEYWESRQERSKNLYSLLLSSLILPSLDIESYCRRSGDKQALADLIENRHFTFIDESQLHVFLTGKDWPDQNSLALRAGTDKTNASRVMKKIKEDLKNMSTQTAD